MGKLAGRRRRRDRRRRRRAVVEEIEGPDVNGAARQIDDGQAGMGEQDDTIIMPLSALQRRLIGKTSSNDINVSNSAFIL